MKKRGFLRPIWLALLVVSLVAGVGLLPAPTVIAQGPPERPQGPPADPNAPPDRPPAPVVGPGRIGGGEEGTAPNACSGVHGFVLNWGYRNEPKLPVGLAGESWQADAATDDNGYYAFNCLAADAARLNAPAPPGLHPMTSDVAIRLAYRADFEVNLGVYSGDVAPTPEVKPVMEVSPGQVGPAAELSYTIRVANTSSQKMDGVMITDLLPPSLTPLSATSSQGATELWGNLLTADVGELAPGQAATVTLNASVREGVAPGAAISNRASLITRDHVAVQTDLVSVQVGQGEPAASSVTEPPTSLPVTGGERGGVDAFASWLFGMVKRLADSVLTP